MKLLDLKILLKKMAMDYKSIKSIFIVSITAAHKMTEDFCYSQESLEYLLEVHNLSNLECKYYELVSYELFVSRQLVEKFLEIFV